MGEEVNADTNLPVVAARGLRKAYKNTLALDDARFEIPAGRIVGLIGPNGAGKTTALKAILGLIPFEGELQVLGKDPRTQRDALMNDVCFIADVAVLPRWITVAQAIEFVAGVHPRFDAARCQRFLEGTQLKPGMKVREMSKGMIVQLHLALVMAIDARLLVLHIEGEAKKTVLSQALADGDERDMPIRAMLRRASTPVDIYWAP